MNLSDKTCIVTGANSGLGFEVARRLAGRGAKTILLCRTRERGDAAVHEIMKESPAASVELAVCDLSSLRSIGAFIDDFEERHSRLDLLYNNAAVMKPKRTTTEDGFETMFQVNYLAAFVLMTSLLDLLRHGSPSLVINSAFPPSALRLDLDDLQSEQDYRMSRCFFKTKLCLLVSALELSRREASDGVSVSMVIPRRPFRSDIARDIRMGWFKKVFSGSVHKAAEDLMYHIDSADGTALDGRVFQGRRERPLTDYWRDREIASQLWSITEAMIETTHGQVRD
jgi:NAD(P)-dependent dehydrogenase (short-subunit alcohol dehydrogenase family)